MKTLDVESLLDQWPALEPSPGFSLRVVDKALAPETPRRWPLYACAAAIALVLVSVLGAPRSREATPVAHAEDLDLGLRTD